jgi:ADP-heptose:LPS heptosyltransferase
MPSRDLSTLTLRHCARAGVFTLRRLRTRLRFIAAERAFRQKFSVAKVTAISLIEHMGDIVACEPVARRVRVQDPDAIVVWFVGHQYRCLVQHDPRVDAVVPVDGVFEWGLWARLPFHRVIDLNVDARPDFVHGVTHRKRHGDPAVHMGNWREFGPLLPAFARAAGLSPWSEAPRLYIPAEVCRSVDELKLPAEFIAVHCVSSGPAKDWTPAKWAELAERVKQEFDLPLVELGTTSVAPTHGDNWIDLCGRLSILQSAEVIRHARLFIGVDSGPAHLANAADTPGVVLLGQWVPFTGGYGDGTNAVLIQQNGGAIADIDAERVFAAVASQLNRRTLCRPKSIK